MTTALYKQVYDEFLANAKDPAWRMAFEMALGEWVSEQCMIHQNKIQAIADYHALRRLDATRAAITKVYVQDKLDEIRKDQVTGTAFNAKWERKEGRFSRYVGPDAEHKPGNQFAVGSTGVTTSTVDPRGTRDTPGWDETRRGYASRRMASEPAKFPGSPMQRAIGQLSGTRQLDPNATDSDHRSDVFENMSEMVNALYVRTNDKDDKQKVQLMISNPESGTTRLVVTDRVPPIRPGERVQFMTPVGQDNPVKVSGKVMNIGTVAGWTPTNSAKAGSVAEDIKDSLETTSWGKRLVNTTNALNTMASGSSVTAQAHAVAQMVNLIGPDAARAFGPRIRQMSYRYAGMEAAPDQMRPVAKLGAEKAGVGVKDYENMLIHDLLGLNKEGSEQVKESDIPTKAEHELSLKSGSTLPSKGFALDVKGNVVSEAVGLSDDWYTPFNLRKLPKIKDGSYVRTRAYGGITPEDLRTAMHTGAKRVTVVSNSGIYTIELDKRASHWGHRFGFGGAVMSRRYTKTLEAIQSGKVNDASSDGNYQLDGTGYEAALKDLKRKYPYYVNNVSYKAKRDMEMGEGVHSDVRYKDTGYVGPLSIKAEGAKPAWQSHDSIVGGQLVPAGSLKGYDQLDQYKMQNKATLQINRRSRGTGGDKQDVDDTWRGGTIKVQGGMLPGVGELSAGAAAARDNAVQGAGKPVVADRTEISSKELGELGPHLDDAQAYISREADKNEKLAEMLAESPVWEEMQLAPSTEELTPSSDEYKTRVKISHLRSIVNLIDQVAEVGVSDNMKLSVAAAALQEAIDGKPEPENAPKPGETLTDLARDQAADHLRLKSLARDDNAAQIVRDSPSKRHKEAFHELQRAINEGRNAAAYMSMLVPEKQAALKETLGYIKNRMPKSSTPMPPKEEQAEVKASAVSRYGLMERDIDDIREYLVNFNEQEADKVLTTKAVALTARIGREQKLSPAEEAKVFDTVFNDFRADLGKLNLMTTNFGYQLDGTHIQVMDDYSRRINNSQTVERNF